MKTLIVTWWRKDYMSYRHHLGMLKKLDATIYDRNDLQQLNNDNRFSKLYRIHKPDVFICYGAMNFIDNANIFDKIGKCLKVCIEPDYHNHFGKESWYNQFDMVVLRNGNDPSKIGPPTFWWPWSVDENEFYSTEEPKRNVIGFAGSSKHHLYTIRNKAIDTLTESGLPFENMRKTIMANECADGMWQGKWTDQGKYQKYLREINGLLTSTENRGPFAKTFEAMMSGTIVLSSPVINKKLFFGKKECFVEYKPDCTNIVEKAKLILNENLEEMANNAYEVCIEKHTSEKRIKELIDNLKNMLEGKKLEKRWGL